MEFNCFCDRRILGLRETDDDDDDDDYTALY
jgi:hypothetical protein